MCFLSFWCLLLVILSGLFSPYWFNFFTLGFIMFNFESKFIFHSVYISRINQSNCFVLLFTNYLNNHIFNVNTIPRLHTDKNYLKTNLLIQSGNPICWYKWQKQIFKPSLLIQNSLSKHQNTQTHFRRLI